MPFLPETWTDPHATFTPLTWALILLAPLILPLAVSTAVGLLTRTRSTLTGRNL